MKGDPLQWFRLYSEFASDPVIQSMSFDDQRHFVIILCLKSSGILDRKFGEPQLRVVTLRRALGLDALAFDEAKRRLCACGLIDGDWQPINWNKRQYISDHDPKAKDRKRKQRDRERHEHVTRDNTDLVTDESRTSHAPQSQSQSQSTESEQSQKREREARAPRSAPARRLPEDFELTPERRAMAQTEKADPDREFAAFTDYWRGASGAKARKHDWDGTWRNWCRRAGDFKPKSRVTDEPQLTWRPGADDNGPPESWPAHLRPRN